MSDAKPRSRLPWFAIWTPLALLLYTLTNGAGHVRVAYAVLGGIQPGKEASWVLHVAAPLCGGCFFFILPAMAVLALATWRLCPQWHDSVRWYSGWAGVYLGILFFLVQAALLCPGGRGGPLPSSAELRIVAVQLWKPQLRRTVLQAFDEASPAWKAQAPAFAALLQDPERMVRWGAVDALGRLEASEYAPQITALLKDPDPHVARCAAEALEALSPHVAPSTY